MERVPPRRRTAWHPDIKRMEEAARAAEERHAEERWIASFAPITIVCDRWTWYAIKDRTKRYSYDTNDQPWSPFDDEFCPVHERSDGALEIEMTAHKLKLLWRELRPAKGLRPDFDEIEAFAARVHDQLAKRLLPVGQGQPDRASPIVLDM